MLPGSIWSVYGDDDETVSWAHQHRNDLFQVTVLGAADEGFKIKYQDGESFGVAFDHIWPFLGSDNQWRAQALSLRIPDNALQVWIEFSVRRVRPARSLGWSGQRDQEARQSVRRSHKQAGRAGQSDAGRVCG